MVLQSGSASAIAFAAFPSMSSNQKEFTLLGCAMLSIFCYLLSDLLHKRQMQAQAQNYHHLGDGLAEGSINRGHGGRPHASQ